MFCSGSLSELQAVLWDTLRPQPWPCHYGKEWSLGLWSYACLHKKSEVLIFTTKWLRIAWQLDYIFYKPSVENMNCLTGDRKLSQWSNVITYRQISKSTYSQNEIKTLYVFFEKPKPQSTPSYIPVHLLMEMGVEEARSGLWPENSIMLWERIFKSHLWRRMSRFDVFI